MAAVRVCPSSVRAPRRLATGRATVNAGGRAALTNRVVPKSRTPETVASSSFSRGFFTTVAGVAIETASRLCEVAGLTRTGLVIECNKKRGKGCTNEGGTKRKRARTSGFRVRNMSSNGKAVLKKRRQKGRKNLAPASIGRVNK